MGETARVIYTYKLQQDTAKRYTDEDRTERTLYDNSRTQHRDPQRRTEQREHI